jgi:hypothetical protein
MMPAPVLRVAAQVAERHAIVLADLFQSRRVEHARARHQWRALVAWSLGYGAAGGVTLSELSRLLECDRDSVRNSLRFIIHNSKSRRGRS